MKKVTNSLSASYRLFRLVIRAVIDTRVSKFLCKAGLIYFSIRCWIIISVADYEPMRDPESTSSTELHL